MGKFICIAAFTILIQLVLCSCLDSNYEHFSNGQQKFSASFLKALNKYELESGNQGNLIFSPFSIHRVLLLAYFGARGETQESLENVLNLQNWAKKVDILHIYQMNKKEFEKQQQQQEYGFSSVDKMYIKTGAQLSEPIKRTLGDNIEELNFQTDTENSRLHINRFVENATRGHIKDLLSHDSVDPSTSVVLANAAYFKGEWAMKFEKEATEAKPFYGTTTANVEMMRKAADFKYQKRDSYLALELPYSNDDSRYSMILILPENKTRNSFDDFIHGEFTENMITSVRNAGKIEVRLELPKMTFNGGYILTEALKSMGLNHLFEGEGDFSDFSKTTKFGFDGILHKAKIEVNEKGSTAAAGTASFIPFGYTRPTYFHCDHPFLFVIYDGHLNQTLFTGVYRDPSPSQQ